MIDCPFVDRSHVIVAEREALKRRYVETLVRIAKLYLHKGSSEMGIAHLEKAALEDEFNEEVWRTLINAYCRANRQAEAVLTCQTHQSVLAQAGLSCSESCLPAELEVGARVGI